MKHLITLFIAVSVAFTAFGQSTPPNKLRSNDSFTQVDNYLVAAKRLGIPTGPTPTLNAATAAQNSAKLFYNTTDESLYVYDAVGEIWNPVSADIDLSEYYTIAQVDSAIAASSPFNLIDVTQTLYTDKAINVRPFNNTGMAYREGSIDFGVTRDSTHTMGTYAFKQGRDTRASGGYSSAFGDQTTASGHYSSSFGQQSQANEYASLAIGRYSIGGPAQTSWTPGSPIFKVGNGTDIGNRSNAYVLNNDGTSTQYGIASYGADYSANFTDRSLVDKEYVDEQSVIESLDEGSGIGYRIRGRNPDNYGNIGVGALDISQSLVASNVNGATGAYSFAAGALNIASGDISFTTGQSNNSSGIGSVTMGSQNISSGLYSVALGSNNVINSQHSFAAGSGNTVTGSHGSAFGGGNLASGGYSIAAGSGNVANEFGSLVIGRNAISGASQGTWSTGSPVFKVGNGTNSGDRRNAYVLYNDGRSEQVKDIEVTEIGQGIVLKSPDGTRWRITVDDSGNLTTTAL